MLHYRFLNYRKLLLSYNNNKWELVQLNLIQLFFRNVLGFYKSTHLDRVLKKWNKIKIYEDPADPKADKCHARLQELWTKRHVIGLGNADASQAEVICFAEDHTDHSFRASVAAFIDKHYQEGDVILVEGTEAGQDIKPNEAGQTKRLTIDCVVRGWEPKDCIALNGSPFLLADTKEQDLLKCEDQAKACALLMDDLSDENMPVVKQKVEELILQIKELNLYYQSKSKSVVEVDRLRNLVELAKAREGGIHESYSGAFTYMSLTILAELKKRANSAFYKNMTDDHVKEILSGINERNASLSQEIDKHRGMSKRVFLIAGASHLLTHPPPWVDNKQVKDTLNKHQFIIITRKDELSDQVASLNTDLTPRQFYN